MEKCSHSTFLSKTLPDQNQQGYQSSRRATGNSIRLCFGAAKDSLGIPFNFGYISCRFSHQ